MKRPAVFLDRDGVLVCAAPQKDYAHGPLTLDDFATFSGIRKPVGRLRAAGYLIVLATNQPGIARGQMNWDTLNEMHRRLGEITPFDDIEICPHTDRDGCACRKPKPGMLLNAAEKLGIDLAASYFVGDTYRDVQAAHSAGVTPVLIDWPYNQDLQVLYRVRNLDEAARVILA